MVASSPESYLNLVEADTNSGLIKFSQDLKAWAMYSSLDNYDAAFATLDKLIAPILDKAIEYGYVYTGDTTKLADFDTYRAEFSSDSYNKIRAIFG